MKSKSIPQIISKWTMETTEYKLELVDITSLTRGKSTALAIALGTRCLGGYPAGSRPDLDVLREVWRSGPGHVVRGKGQGVVQKLLSSVRCDLGGGNFGYKSAVGENSARAVWAC